MTHLPGGNTQPKADRMTFEEWLIHGVTSGWISPPDCSTHNMTPMRAWEEHEFNKGYDPCIITIRLWRDGFEHIGPNTPVQSTP